MTPSRPEVEDGTGREEDTSEARRGAGGTSGSRGGGIPEADDGFPQESVGPAGGLPETGGAGRHWRVGRDVE